MKQEDKELLFQDLCSRLPYGVKVQFRYIITSPAILKGINKDLIECDIAVCEIQDIKPYLFPISSMTEEQKREYNSLCSIGTDECGDITYFNTFESIDWLNKNHFDYRGLIPMGLANNASGLNIY